MATEKQITSMITAIEASAHRQIEAILENANARREDALQAARKRAEEEIDFMLNAKLTEIRRQTGQQICRAENEARGDLFRRREAIRQEVFEKATRQIIAFTQTPAYEAFLIASAQRIYTAMGRECKVLNVRECDTPYAAKIAAHLGRSITVHTDPTIVLGGMIVESADGSMMIDDTLDSRLHKQQIWFREQSGLVIE